MFIVTVQLFNMPTAKELNFAATGKELKLLSPTIDGYIVIDITYISRFKTLKWYY